MQHDDVRERDAQTAPGGEVAPDEPATDRNDKRLDHSGGLRYQQAHRVAGATLETGLKQTAGGRSELARETAAPEQDQRTDADDRGGLSPDDEAWLGDQGYPKLGKKIQSRMTQVEHGPYAGGTQQGDASSREKRPNARERR